MHRRSVGSIQPLKWALLALGLVAAIIGTLNTIFGLVSAEVSIGLAVFVVVLGVGIIIWSFSGSVGDLAAYIPPQRERYWEPELPSKRTLPPPPLSAEPPAQAAKRSSRSISLAKVGLIVGIGAGVITIANGIIEYAARLAAFANWIERSTSTSSWVARAHNPHKVSS
jgi:hypothetical protein